MSGFYAPDIKHPIIASLNLGGGGSSSPSSGGNFRYAPDDNSLQIKNTDTGGFHTIEIVGNPNEEQIQIQPAS